jgi:hypothetical protein
MINNDKVLSNHYLASTINIVHKYPSKTNKEASKNTLYAYNHNKNLQQQLYKPLTVCVGTLNKY